MKVAILGDAHFGAIMGLGKPTEDGSNTRIKDYEKSMDFCIDYCIRNKIDAFVQTGDLFEKRNPSPIEIEAADKAIRRLSTSNIPTFIIMGNHDYKRFGGTYTSALLSMPAKHYTNVRILIDPDVISVTNNNYERVNLLLMPFRDKRMYPGDTTAEKSLNFENHISDLFKTCNEKFPTVFVGHNFFYEGSYAEFGGSEMLVNPNTFKDFSASFMGHYHSQKDIDPSINCYYTGSMERTNFGEAKQDKYLFIYDTVTCSVEKIKIPCKELTEIILDFSNSEISEVVSSLKERIDEVDVQDKIVRMRVAIQQDMNSLIKKKELEKKLYKKGAHFVAKVQIENKFRKVSRDTSALKEETDFKMFVKFLSSQKLPKDLCAKVEEQAKMIME